MLLINLLDYKSLLIAYNSVSYTHLVNSVADVFVNYQTVAHHLGGYTAFCTEITDQVEDGANALEVWVSNAYRTDVLPISGEDVYKRQV